MIILKRNGILTLELLEKSNQEELEQIFDDNAKYYKGNFSSWIEQASCEELKAKTSNPIGLKDLF